MSVEDLSILLRQVQERVRTNRINGLYPPGLENELEFEFSEIMKRAGGGDPSTITDLKDLVLSRLAVVDHLALLVVELEARLLILENQVKEKT